MEIAQEQAKKLIRDVQYQAAQMLEELETLKKQKDKEDFSQKVSISRSQIKGKLQKLDDIANPVKANSEEKYILPRKLQIGDHVQLIDVGSKGVVISEADRKGRYQIQAGSMRLWTKETNLMLLNEKVKQQVGKTTRTVKSQSARKVQTEVDLRGLTVEEALLELDQFIDNAVMTNINVISIIHGKGTGALRTAVQNHLKRHRNIKTFRLGVYGEGESGVTIAELK